MKVGDKVTIVMPEQFKGIVGVIDEINGCDDDIYYLVSWKNGARNAWLHAINILPFSDPEKVIFT